MPTGRRRSAALLLALATLALTAGACGISRSPLKLTDEERLSEPELWPGDPAPPLAASEWVQGEPVDEFQPGAIYVVDFWATWCGPCRASMPRLSRLADEFADDGVVVIAMTTVDSDNSPEAIRRHVREHAQDMRFRVAIDRATQTADAYRRAAREAAIPRSFIIGRDGRLAWIGHPALAEPVVGAVVAGTWDPGAAAAERREARRREQEESRVLASYREAYQSGDQQAQLAALEALCEIEFVQLQGVDKHSRFTSRVRLLKKLGRPEEAMAVARRCAGHPTLRDDAWMHADLAEAVWDLDEPFAGELADRAAAILDAESGRPPGDEWDQHLRGAPYHSQPYMLLATVRFRQGRAAEAVAAQRTAIEFVSAPVFATYAEPMRAALEKYERAATAADPVP